MGNKASQAQLTNKRGDQLVVQSQETDSPILPVAQLQQLHEFRPDLVDFVIEQTRLEAEHRRGMTNRVNLFVFLEHVIGQVLALIVAILGVGGGIYAGLNGQPALGASIATVTIGSLAVAYITRNKAPPPPPTPKK
jgi:hypothetical protein